MEDEVKPKLALKSTPPRPRAAVSRNPILVGPIKAMLPLRFVAIISSTLVLSSGCQKKTAATNPDSQSETELDENTKPLQAADIVGYDGTTLRKSVDHIRQAQR